MCRQESVSSEAEKKEKTKSPIEVEDHSDPSEEDQEAQEELEEEQVSLHDDEETSGDEREEKKEAEECLDKRLDEVRISLAREFDQAMKKDKDQKDDAEEKKDEDPGNERGHAQDGGEEKSESPKIQMSRLKSTTRLEEYPENQLGLEMSDDEIPPTQKDLAADCEAAPEGLTSEEETEKKTFEKMCTIEIESHFAQSLTKMPL